MQSDKSMETIAREVGKRTESRRGGKVEQQCELGLEGVRPDRLTSQIAYRKDEVLPEWDHQRGWNILSGRFYRLKMTMLRCLQQDGVRR